MLNYLKAEFWRFFRRPAGRVIWGAAVLLPVLLNLLLWIVSLYTRNKWPQWMFTLESTCSEAALLMPIAGIFFLMAVVDVAFADENRLGILKNSVAAGFSRHILYWGKILSGLLLAIFHLVSAWISFLVSGFVLLPVNWGEIGKTAEGVWSVLLAVFPLWLGVLGILYLLYFSFQNGLVAAVTTAVASLFLPMLAGLDFPWLQSVLENQLLIGFVGILLGATLDLWDIMAKFWIMGSGYFLVSVLAGWILFCRRDIR